MYNKKTKSFSLNLNFLLNLTKKRVHKLNKRQNNKPVNLSLIKTFVTKKLFGEHKHIVNDPYRLFKILLVYSYDYIKLAGALIYHFDIYIGMGKGGKNTCGGSFFLAHISSHHRDQRHIVYYLDMISVGYLWNIAHRIGMTVKLLGADHYAHGVDTGGDMLEAEAFVVKNRENAP